MDKFINGNTYVLDKGFKNHSLVRLISQGKIFALVESVNGGGRWETMLNRLSEI